MKEKNIILDLGINFFLADMITNKWISIVD